MMAKTIIIKMRTNIFMRINARVSVSPIAVSFNNHGYAFSKHLVFRVHFFHGISENSTISKIHRL